MMTWRYTPWPWLCWGQVMVVEPGIDQYTGDNRVVLCTKRRSDIIWVPAVNRLVSELSLERRRFVVEGPRWDE